MNQPQPLNAITHTNLPKIADLLSLGNLGLFIVKEVELVPRELYQIYINQGFEVIYSQSFDENGMPQSWAEERVLKITGVWNGARALLLLDGNPVSMLTAIKDETMIDHWEDPFWINIGLN